MSISVNMSVRDALALLTGGEASNNVLESIIKAIEDKCGSVSSTTGSLNFTLKSFPIENRLKVIKAIRVHTGWGLKEAKEFCDIVSGPWSETLDKYGVGTPNTMTVSKNIAEQLNKELVALCCDTYVDSW